MPNVRGVRRNDPFCGRLPRDRKMPNVRRHRIDPIDKLPQKFNQSFDERSNQSSGNVWRGIAASSRRTDGSVRLVFIVVAIFAK